MRDPLTVACGDCVDGAYESNEECLDCGNSGALPFICICIAGLVLVVAGTIFINSDMHKVTAASMMAMTAGSLLVTGLGEPKGKTQRKIISQNSQKKERTFSEDVSEDS